MLVCESISREGRATQSLRSTILVVETQNEQREGRQSTNIHVSLLPNCGYSVTSWLVLLHFQTVSQNNLT